MARAAVAEGTVCALRETIARMEGEAVPALIAMGRDPSRAGFRQDTLASQPGASTPISTKLSDQSDHMAKQQKKSVFAFGDAGFDVAMGGGLPLAGLSEFRAEETRDIGAAAGFTLAMAAACQARFRQSGHLATPPAVMWIGETLAYGEGGVPYGPGLSQHGLLPERFFAVRPRRLEEALYAAEMAAAVPALAAVILEIRGNPRQLSLNETRRLHFRARACGRPFFILRQAGLEEASAALVRLHIRPSPSSDLRLSDGSVFDGGIGRPAFHLTLEKSRAGRPAETRLEWNADDCRFQPASELPSRADINAPPSQSTHSGIGSAASDDGSDRTETMGHLMAFNRAS